MNTATLAVVRVTHATWPMPSISAAGVDRPRSKRFPESASPLKRGMLCPFWPRLEGPKAEERCHELHTASNTHASHARRFLFFQPIPEPQAVTLRTAAASAVAVDMVVEESGPLTLGDRHADSPSLLRSRRLYPLVLLDPHRTELMFSPEALVPNDLPTLASTFSCASRVMDKQVSTLRRQGGQSQRHPISASEFAIAPGPF